MSFKEKTGKRVVLVGTYRAGQLERWPGYYNYPLNAGDAVDAGAAKRVDEIWLFNGARDGRYFAAEFVGTCTRDELVRDWGYPAKGAAHGEKYLLYRIQPAYAPANTPDALAEEAERVIVRAADFAKRSPKIARAIKAYLESSDRNAPGLANRLPSILLQVPRETLCVCEPGVQMEFFSLLSDSAFYAHGRVDYFAGGPKEKSLAELCVQHQSEANGFTHVDCFSGVGGFCTGLHAAGFTTKVAIEKIRSCVETYEANHPEVRVINEDICKVRAEDILPYCPKGGVDLVTSGMPCETFSTAGNTSRSFYDERQFLFRQGIRVAQITNAKFLLFENVPAITTKTTEKGSKDLIVDVLKEEISKAGYGNFIEVVLDATKFGVPQKRKRYFVLGTRLKNVSLSKPRPFAAKAVTVGEAFDDLPSVTPNTGVEETHYLPRSNTFTELMRDNSFWRREGTLNEGRLSYQMPMKHRPATLERFGLLRPGEGLRELFERYTGRAREALQSRRVLPKKMFIKRNYRLPVEMPSPCVTSHCLDEFVHPTENRALTVRECARLQSFPDSYDFVGGPYIVPHIDREVQDKYEQIGDAVPPLLAYAWGVTISRMLKEASR